ncbi:hypothetical protein [Elioraea thermophila]|uniref:hypothetical protein n=1 Tax=Elioraea thermophila TaxID=2185104 RepID=UPI000DF3FD79|nr:hypothetical protein [Elioraea thermophila]
MSLGLREARRAERRRRRQRNLLILLVLGALIGLGALAYETGSRLAQLETDALRGEIEGLRRTIAGLEQARAATEARLRETEARLAEREAAYARDVPSGAGRELYALIQQRLGEGLSPDRLALVLRNATAGTRCEPEIETRRFLLATPIARGGANAVTMSGGIVITGEGVSARAADGSPHAWFDPAQPVTIAAIQPGGARTEAQGVLPVAFSVVRGATEHRFVVSASDLRGFVQVAAERCAYP